MDTTPHPRRRSLMVGAALAPWVGDVHAQPGRKRLRVSFNSPEAGFDPARQGDLYSATVQAHIFEPLFTYDPLASPPKLIPLTAAGPAEHEDNFRTWTIRLQPGIYFDEHPAFEGRRRELVAADYVYSLKRFVDPEVRSGGALIPDLRLLGLADLARSAGRGALDYGRAIPGLRALDRYTLQLRCEEPRPRLPMTLAYAAFGAVAREVVQAHGATVGEHPVGTGPFRLTQWRRGSRILLERHPGYRERRWQAEPATDDLEGQAIAQRLSGRLLPMVDEVEISIIAEEQPQWLAFLGGQLDMLLVPGNYANQAMPGGQVAPHLARRGVRGQQALTPSVRLTWFNMQHPLVGGYAPHQVALRRAIALGMDCERDHRLVDGGQALPAHGVFAPFQSGFQPGQRSEMGRHDPARARALLDLYGYRPHDRTGWRMRPDGQPLVLERATQGDQRARRIDEGFVRDMRALGLQVRLRIGQFGENIKAARAGQLMMWGLGYNAVLPDGQQFLARFYSRVETFARFSLPAMDRLYERLGALPDGPERLALMHEAERIAIAYMPYKFTALRIETHLTLPRLVGFRRPVFRNDWFHLVDLDGA